MAETPLEQQELQEKQKEKQKEKQEEYPRLHSLRRNPTSQSSQPPHLSTLHDEALKPIQLPCCGHKISSKKIVLVIRCAVLVLSLTCLVLDIISINFFFSHRFPFALARLVAPHGAYAIYVFFPDILVVALMLVLLWKRIRLPDRMWLLHIACRVFFSLVIVAFALVCPLYQVYYFATNDDGWARYFCQVGDFGGHNRTMGPPVTTNTTDTDSAMTDPNTYTAAFLMYQQQELQQLKAWNDPGHTFTPQQIQNFVQELLNSCRVMRSRSLITLLWTLLVLFELVFSFLAREFQRRGHKISGNSLNWMARESELNEWACYSSSEVWQEGVRQQDPEQQQGECSTRRQRHQRDQSGTAESKQESRASSRIFLEHLSSPEMSDTDPINRETECYLHHADSDINQHQDNITNI